MIETGTVVVENDVTYVEARGGPLSPDARLLLRVVDGQIVGYTVREVTSGGRDRDNEGDEELEVHYIDVGKGSSTLVEAPNGETMLVDAGGVRKKVARRVRAYIESEGIDTIDYLILTHGHEDHIKGVLSLLEDESIDVEAVYYSGLETDGDTENRVLGAIREDPNTELKPPIRTGDGGNISPGGLDVDVLNPPNPPRAVWNKSSARPQWFDSNSLVLKFSYEGETFLLPSDIRNRVEPLLGEHRGVTTMTASHHGSKSANTEALYRNTTPDRVVISARRVLGTEPPHGSVFDTLDRFDAATYWTNVHGNITFTVDDGELFVEVENPATTDPDDLKDKIGTLNPLLRAPVPP